MSLLGKRALITGGSRGIGSAIAKRLAADGADIAITYAANQEAADATIKAVQELGRRGYAIQADAGDETSQRAGFDAAAKALGGIDILVHNAGVTAVAAIEDDVDETFDRLFAVNVRGVHIGTRAALPYMPDGGRIILIGSMGAETAPFPGLSNYSATKAALGGFARGWARDLAARNILVNVIQPGPIETDMAPKGDVAEMFKQIVPLGRFGTAEELAGAASFLAGPDSSFITGSIINVDGGVLI